MVTINLLFFDPELISELNQSESLGPERICELLEELRDLNITIEDLIDLTTEDVLAEDIANN